MPHAPVEAAEARDAAARRPSGRDRWEIALRSPAGISVLSVVLGGGAALLRFGPLGPPSLWLDDAWPALVVKAEGFSEIVMTGVTAPGFAFVLRGWLDVVGFSEANAQMIPFVAGILGPAAVYLAVVRLRQSAWAGIASAAVVLASPVHVGVSTRVKPYTAEMLGAAALIALAWAAVERPRRTSPWVWLVVAGTALTLLSSILAVPAWAGLGAAVMILVARRERITAGAAIAIAAFAVFSFAYWWWFLRDAVNAELEAYWASTYVSLDGIGEALISVGDGFLRLADGLLPLDAGVGVAVLAAATAVVLWRRPPLAVLLLMPTAAALILAAAGRLPFGGGRTDPYLYPNLAILVGAGIVEAAGVVSRRALPAAAAATLVGLVVLAPASPGYPRQDVRALVQALERRVGPGDAIVVYPVTNFAYGLYTSGPVDLVPTGSYATGFRASPDRPGTYVLPPYRDEPARYEEAIASVAARHDRAWFIASHLGPDVPAILGFFRDHGFEIATETRARGAVLIEWASRREG